MDLIEAAQRIAAVSADLNRNNEARSRIADRLAQLHQEVTSIVTDIEELKEPLEGKTAEMAELDEYMETALAADMEHQLGRADSISGCKDELAQANEQVMSAHSQVEEAGGLTSSLHEGIQAAAEQMTTAGTSITDAEGHCDNALSALNG